MQDEGVFSKDMSCVGLLEDLLVIVGGVRRHRQPSRGHKRLYIHNAVVTTASMRLVTYAVL